MFEEILTENGIKFKDLEQKIFKFVCFLGCMLIKLILENQDKRLMKSRNKEIYRHKGYRKNTIKTVLGEIEYTRAMYCVKDGEEVKYIFLLDETLKISTCGKISENLAETVLNIVPETKSYRKASETLELTTNEILSHEAIRDLVLVVGEKQNRKEQEEISLMKQNKLIKGLKEITALFEEADGLWINLQGKDRKEAQEKYKRNCERKGKEYIPLRKTKAELKLHVTYEGWKVDDTRHKLINKKYIAGMMKPKQIKELRDARVYQTYNIDKIELRVLNGDGAKWIDGIKAKGTISQKDKFHIKQEIRRSVPEEYRNLVEEVIENKEYDKLPIVIEQLKFELGGEENTVKKLERLKRYLSTGLERYQDVLKREGKTLVQAPEGVEYRNAGTMESQIFTVLKVRLASGRKSFSIKGADALAKVCALKVEEEGKIELSEIERKITIDNSVEEWINELEQKYKNSGPKRVDLKELADPNKVIKNATICTKFMKEILKMKEFSEMKCSY